MRVSLNWLREYVDLPTTDVDELTRAFDMLGHAVEEVEHFTADWTDVVIGRVERIEAHPNADAVRVTHVDLGDGTATFTPTVAVAHVPMLEIVNTCGATSAPFGFPIAIDEICPGE